MIKRVPCFYFPCTTVLIDDDKLLLSSLSKILAKDTLCNTFSKPSDGIKYIKMHSKPTFITNCIISSDDALKSIAQLSIDVYEFHKHVDVSDRHNLCNVLVIDYAMPQKNGLDVCRELMDLPIGKILLTGETDEQLAVSAFNEGIINAFIRKDHPQFEEQLISKIKKMQMTYFQQFSDVVYQALEWITDPSECLKSLKFHRYIESIIHKNKIVEYYLFDTTGSFIFFDNVGKTSILAVRSEDSMDSARDAIEFSEDDVPANVAKTLATNDYLLFTGKRDDLTVTPAAWAGNIYQASQMSINGATYYYSYLDDFHSKDK